MFAFDAISQQTWDFDFTNDYQAFEIPATGLYKLEAWGAEGAAGNWDDDEKIGGTGGFAAGQVMMEEGDMLYIYVGEKPDRVTTGAAGGGGATDFRYSNGDGTWMSSEGLYSRILVAGGGSGSHGSNYSDPSHMGAGGGLTATVSYYSGLPSSNPASQTAGGSDNFNSNGFIPEFEEDGQFGYAGYALGTPTAYVGNYGGFNGGGKANNWALGGGGGGWYGGATCWPQGGGGSGYVLTSSSFRPEGYNPSTHYEFDEEELIAGNLTMTDPQGNSVIGNRGNGYARITQLYSVGLLSLTDATCSYNADGSITTDAIGGMPPYSFLWNDGQIGATASNLSAGEHTVTITDANGLETSRTFSIGPDPIAITFAITQSSSCGETGDGALEAQVSGGTAPYSYVWSSAETDAAISNKAIGEYSVLVTDANNCTAEAAESITSDDSTNPTVLVKAANIYLDADGLATVSVSDINDGSYDDCAIDSMYVSNPDFDCADAGTPGLSAILVVVDFSGNHASAEANINLIDTIKPLAKAKNIEVLLDDEGIGSIVAMDADDGSTDNCSIASRKLNVSEFSCGGDREVTLTVTDASGNESKAVFTVTVVDQLAPIIPALVTMNVYLGEDGTVAFDSAPLLAAASDNCGLDAIVALGPDNEYIDVNGYPVSCSEVGNTQVPLFVRDNSGNLTGFTLAVTVIDTIKPSFNLDFIELEIDANGNAFLTEAMLMPYALDNCAIAEVAIQTGSYDCSKVGTPQYTEILVYDMSGNYKQQTLEVQIIDIIVPTVQVNDITLALNANGQVELSVDLLEMIADDNCAPTNFAFSQTVFSCADIGTTTVTITVADAAGNSGVAEFKVTVVDNLAPEIMAPQIIQVCYGTPVSYDEVVAVDNCSAQLTLIDGPQPGSILEIGDYLVEFQAVDPSGNTTSSLVLVAVSARAEVYLGEDRLVEAGSTVTLVAGQDEANRYLWSDGSIGMVYQFVATEDVIVSVTVTSPAGCSISDEIKISIASTVGIDEDTAGNSVRFYPNPTRGQMSIALSLTKVATDVRMNITDITGKSVVQRVIPMAKDGDVLSLDLSAFADGIYLVNLQSESFNLTERVVKH